MSNVAKGCFPGHPRKKLQKKKVKFQKKLVKTDLGELRLSCSYISNVIQKFHETFDDSNDKDAEFIGFSSEECGLQAYKRVSKKYESSSPAAIDILGSSCCRRENDKVTTRRSCTIQKIGAAVSEREQTPSSCSSQSESPSRNTNPQKDLDTSSSSVSDSAFLKYKNFKLDFHRLSKKAKNRDVYEGCSAEEQAERKDASTASLKYVSDIYLAKNHAVLGQVKSPIKPATFIAPPSQQVMHVLPTSETSLKIKRGVRLKEDAHDSKKGSSHPQVLAKALLARASRSRKPDSVESTAKSTQMRKDKRPKSPRGFVLPVKSARSARIIKANRKYMDEGFVKQGRDRVPHSCELTSSAADQLVSPAKCSVTISRMEGEADLEKENLEAAKASELMGETKTLRKPLIKQPTFCIHDKHSNSLAARPFKSSIQDVGNTDTQLRTRGLIKRARFKHPTSSDALVLPPNYKEDHHPIVANKNPIRPSTFTTPITKKRGRPLKKPASSPVASTENLGSNLTDFGLSKEEWRRLHDVHNKKWIVGPCIRDIPPWSVQEVHNLLHGAHTFGGMWSSIARQYDFHELHRDSHSVSTKGKLCQKIGLLNSAYKVKSTILLQLKPKLSDNPNVTVFTPQELNVRGLSENIHFNVNLKKQRQRYFFNTPQTDESNESSVSRNSFTVVQKSYQKSREYNSSDSPSSAPERIFGTELNVNPSPAPSTGSSQHTVVKLSDINKADLYLGLTTKEMLFLLTPRILKLKAPWVPWEIHNILHGINYFGIGSWQQIHRMYKFLDTHDNIAIRGRFKSVCCRNLIVAGKVRADIVPKLHVVLSPKGKKYFLEKRISVKICQLSKREKMNQSLASLKKIAEKERRRKKREAILERKLSKHRRKTGAVNHTDSESDKIPISPPRRAVHLFGTSPVWDEAQQSNIVNTVSDVNHVEQSSNNLTTSVLDALEDGLRRNMTSPISRSTVTLSSSDHSLASPPLAQPSSRRSRTFSESKAQKSQTHRNRSTSKDKAQPSTKTKANGPRIKHVCRRASLVTGQPQATFEDLSPHLSALPRDEREKIAARVDKANNMPNASSSSESEHCKQTTKTPNISTRRDKRSRKRVLHHRCGSCETCMEPPCKACDACRKAVNVRDASLTNTKECFQRQGCLNPITNEPATMPKKSKKVLSDLRPASRKSSRLQQQRVPLKSAPTIDNQHLSNVGSTVSCRTSKKPGKALYSISTSLSSPGTEVDVFENLNRRKQALIKVDKWKGTYDLDLLWKSGGHALITSTPDPPLTLCLLCGSHGLSGDESDELVYCSSCCEAFHVYCADSRNDREIVKNAMKTGMWLCRRCQFCQVCGCPDNLLECRQCRKTYHSDCLGASYPTKPKSKKKSWVCMQCVRCKSCGASKPGSSPGTKWTHNCTMCQRCGDLYDKGNYCTICRRCYHDEDYECRMMQCASCKRWIHSKCEGLTVEMYTLLTHMPDSVQYKCPVCDERGVKLKEEFGADFLKKDQKNFSRDVEKIRVFLLNLPDPPWKKMMQKEVQSGLETIIMALFHNKSTCCILKKNMENILAIIHALIEPLKQCNKHLYETYDRNDSLPASSASSPLQSSDPTKPRDLFAVRFAVHNRRYKSIEAFHCDVRNILCSVPDVDDRLAVEKAFKEEAECVFSWFNFEAGKIRDINDLPDDILPDATIPPYPDHDYAHWQDKDVPVSGVLYPSPAKHPSTNSSGTLCSPVKDAEDHRQCIFCNKFGDDKAMNCGRLLYCGQDEWCHVNCALWSAEVYEQHDGSLENVHSAASRGKMLKCNYCRLPGATVGCNTRDCPKNYHFMCARDANCVFEDDKKVFCRRHASHAVHKQLRNDVDFLTERLICVDNDEMRPNRRWQGGMLAPCISVSIGSLTVQHVGKLGAASVSKDFLTPITYKITRVFWSTFHVFKKTVYTITVTEQKPFDSERRDHGTVIDHSNMTISHGHQEEIKESSTEASTKTKAPVFLSPPRPCRTNLMERMRRESHIGPLSPIKRATSPDSPPQSHNRSCGTYTIIANINKALPQAITPLPSCPTTSAPSSTTDSEVSQLTIVEKVQVAISPSNPFINEAAIQAQSSIIAKPDVVKHQENVTNTKHTNDISLVSKSISSITNNTREEITCASSKLDPADEIPVSHGCSSQVKASPVSSHVSSTQTREISTEQLSINSIPILAPELPVTSFQPGVSGSLLNSSCRIVVPNNRKDENCSTSIPIPFTDHETFHNVQSPPPRCSANQACLPKVAGENTPDTFQSLPCSSDAKSAPSLSTEAQNQATVTFQAAPIVHPSSLNSFERPNSTFLSTSKLIPVFSPSSSVTKTNLSPTISLIEDARRATHIENQETIKVFQAKPPSLWWRKHELRRRSKSRKPTTIKKENDIKKKIPESPKRDPSFKVAVSLNEPFWKTKGEASSPVNHLRVMERRSSRHSKSIYKEITDSETESETEISSFQLNLPTPFSDKNSSGKPRETLMKSVDESHDKPKKGVRQKNKRQCVESAKLKSNLSPSSQQKHAYQKPESDRKVCYANSEENCATSNLNTLTNKNQLTESPRNHVSFMNEESDTDSSCTSTLSMDSVEGVSLRPEESRENIASSDNEGNANDVHAESPGHTGICNNGNSLRRAMLSVQRKEAFDAEVSPVRSLVGSEDDESKSPRMQLRKFAHKLRHKASTPKGQTTTRNIKDSLRQRSKSHDPTLSSKSEKPLVSHIPVEGSERIRKNSPIVRSRHSSDISDSSVSLIKETKDTSAAGRLSNTQRRYPRRNTYTCLKSFSGLSTNYALASYVREDKVLANSRKRRKSKRKKAHVMHVKTEFSNTDEMNFVHEESFDDNPSTRNLENQRTNSGVLARVENSNVCESSTKECHITDDKKLNLKTYDCDEAAISIPEASKNAGLPDTGLNSVGGNLLDEERSASSKQNMDPDILMENSIEDLVEETKLEDFQDIVKSLVDGVLDTLAVETEVDGVQKQEDHLTSFLSSGVDNGESCQGNDKTTNSSFCDTNSSVEVFRGKGDDEKISPLMDLTASSSVCSTPMEKPKSFSNLLSDVPAAVPVSDSVLNTDPNASIAQIGDNPIEMGIVPHIMDANDPSLFESTECPVLSADDVKTFLDDPIPQSPVTMQTQPTSVADLSKLPPGGLPINQLQMSPLPSHVFPVRQNLSMTPPCISHPVQPLFMGAPNFNQSRGAVNASFPLQQASPTNVIPGPPATYVNPPVEAPGASPHPYSFPLQPFSQPVYTAPIVQSPPSLPYSLRVTMAMADALHSDVTATCSSPIRPARRKPFKRQQSFHSPRYRHSCPPRARTGRPWILNRPEPRPARPLVYRPLLDNSSGLKMPRTSMLGDGQLRSISNSSRSTSSFWPPQSVTSDGSPHQPQGIQLNSRDAQSTPAAEKPRTSPSLGDKEDTTGKEVNSSVPLPHAQTQSSSQLASLDQLIEYYSAKNNLTKEEKAIVRSIISNQMKSKRLPAPACTNPVKPVVSKAKVLTKPSTPSATKAPNLKRRSSLQESASKLKRKRKEKHVKKKDLDESLWLPPAQDDNQPSVLLDIYNKRHSHADLHKKPLTKILSPFNIFLGHSQSACNKESRLPPPPSNSKKIKSRSHLIYEIKSEDGYYAKGTELHELISQLLNSVQECRSVQKSCNSTLALHSVMKPQYFLGVSHDVVRFIVEQLPGARHCHRYRAKYHKHKKIKEDITHINPHGCCRAEQYKGRSKPDMFSFLASKHRIPPFFQLEKSQTDDMVQLSNRRATSMEDLPMAMRFRHLRTFSKEAVGVYRSSIHGRGLYCKRDIEDGEMIMEYTGQIVRKELTDKREKYYESKSIGCYMFRMDDFFVVDATVMGSAARFINHSCEPNCYSRIVHIEGKKHIVIFALRKIYRGEELTYDYKFPIEDEMHKITCNCGARTCRKYMN